MTEADSPSQTSAGPEPAWRAKPLLLAPFLLPALYLLALLALVLAELLHIAPGPWDDVTYEYVFVGLLGVVWLTGLVSTVNHWDSLARKMRRRLPRVLRRGIVRVSRRASRSRGHDFLYLGVVVLPLIAFMAMCWKLVGLFFGRSEHYLFTWFTNVTAILGSTALWLILVSLLAGIWPATKRTTKRGHSTFREK